MNSHEILIVIGTRPELIKVAPLIHEFKRRNFVNYKVVNSGQHKELLDMYWDVFDIQPDYDLNIITPNQDLTSLTCKALLSISDLIKKLINNNQQPIYLLSQGDTTTVMASSLAAFYNNIKFLHLEAGLRSNDLFQPFPEEFNRKIAGITTYMHFAPTQTARENLLKENISNERIFITGNTIVDSLKFIEKNTRFKELKFSCSDLNKAIDKYKKIVLVTCHRRENHSFNLEELVSAIIQLAKENMDHFFIWPVHANPNVKTIIEKSELKFEENVLLTKSLNYLELIKLMSLCSLIITDSGGIQEEAPSFKIPVLVLREVTERPEGIRLGIAKLVSCKSDKIIEAFYNFKPSFDLVPSNPYGDGKSAERIVDIILKEKDKSIVFK